MNEVAQFDYGLTASAADVGEYRFVRITDITDSGKLAPNGIRYATEACEDYLLKPGDLLVARTGATFGKTALISGVEPAVFASFLIRIRVDSSVLLPGYYWHFAQSELYWRQARRLVGRGGQPQFNANVLRKIELPIPPLAEQARIVSVLDQFDALVNDLSVGLPAELAARRRQYEYYRDRLLTFREAA